jgi:hypothetical protein
MQPETTSDLERRELRIVLDEELNRLPEKYRAPLVLCYLEGKTNEEAASQLNWTKGTVSGRLARARDLLRDRLARRGMALPAAGLAAVLTEQMASATLPPALADTTVKAALQFAAQAAVTTGASPVRVAALAEGVLQAMHVTKLKIAAALLLAVGLLGFGAGLIGFRSKGPSVAVAVPVNEDKPESKPKSDPPGVPLEMKLLARKDSYTLDLGGKTAAEFRKQVEATKNPQAANVPSAPAAEFAVEIRNAGKTDVELVLGDQFGDFIRLDLQGPDALAVDLSVVVPAIRVRPRPVKLAPGKTYVHEYKSLSQQSNNQDGFRAYWLKPGEYTLTATLGTAVRPAPKDAGAPFDGKMFRELKDQGWGGVTLTSNAITFKVVEPNKDATKTDPPGVPLEMRAVLKRPSMPIADSLVLDRSEGRNQLDAPPPAVDLLIELRNTSDKPLQMFTGGDGPMVNLEFAGPGKAEALGQRGFDERYRRPISTTWAAGETKSLPVAGLDYHLSAGPRQPVAYRFDKPGEYLLTVTFRTSVSPAPKGAAAVPGFKDYGRVTLTSAPVKLTVVAADEKGKTDPPGVPLELELVAKKNSYTLDLGGRTPEEFRKLLGQVKRGEEYPASPAVDLEVILRNTGDKEITVATYANFIYRGSSCLSRAQGRNTLPSTAAALCPRAAK